MSIASRRPSGENRMLNQFVALAHSGVLLPAAIHRIDLPRPTGAPPWQIDESAVARDANCAPPLRVLEATPPSTEVAWPVVCRSAEIERHGEEHAVVEVHEVPARQISGVIAASVHDLRRATRQRLHDEVRIVDRSRTIRRRIEYAATARQHLGPPLVELSSGERSQRFGLAPGC